MLAYLVLLRVEIARFTRLQVTQKATRDQFSTVNPLKRVKSFSFVVASTSSFT